MIALDVSSIVKIYNYFNRQSIIVFYNLIYIYKNWKVYKINSLLRCNVNMIQYNRSVSTLSIKTFFNFCLNRDKVQLCLRFNGKLLNSILAAWSSFCPDVLRLHLTTLSWEEFLVLKLFELTLKRNQKFININQNLFFFV